MSDLTAPSGPQYSLRRILGVWALASLPMPLLAFWVGPALFPGAGWQAGVGVWVLLIGGMVWQGALSLLLLAAEGQSLRWPALKARLWLGLPRDPRTGRPRPRLFLWLLPMLLLSAAIAQSPVADALEAVTLRALPWLGSLPTLDLAALAQPELVGAWWLLGIALVACLFNYLLGEELLFRGVLLPRMQGVFGRWDWVANAVLFGAYHLHRPLSIATVALGALAWTWPSRRFRCTWFAVILHGVEGLVVLGLVFAVVSRLAFTA